MMETNLYELLKPTKVNNLIRLGSSYDGGYWLPSSVLKRSKVLIGLGIFINWSFEDAFIHEASNPIQVFLADASVSEKFFKNYFFKATVKFIYFSLKQPLSIAFFYKKHIQNSIGLANRWKRFNAENTIVFFPKFLTATEAPNQMTPSQLLSQVLEKAKPLDNDIVIKMDIEGSEYEVLELLEPYFKYINCILIEFHQIHIKKELFANNIALLKKYFQIVFVHNNNNTNMIDDNFSESIEISFVKNDLITDNYTSEYLKLSEKEKTISVCNPTKNDIQPKY